MDESHIHCSHCDKIILDNKLPTEPLEDGSYLCELCAIKLQDELSATIQPISEGG
jgi:hypothetical protein